MLPRLLETVPEPATRATVISPQIHAAGADALVALAGGGLFMTAGLQYLVGAWVYALSSGLPISTLALACSCVAMTIGGVAGAVGLRRWRVAGIDRVPVRPSRPASSHSPEAPVIKRMLHHAVAIVALTLAALATSACPERKGPAEKAGEKIDNAIDKAKDAVK